MKKWFSKHKKLVIILLIIAVLISVALILVQNSKQSLSDTNMQQTATVEYRDITSLITASGTIESSDSMSLKTTLTGLEITEVRVEVGDSINAGDVICVFDTSDIAENLSDAQTNLNVASSQSNISISNAERNLESAQTTHDFQVNNAADAVTDALDAYQDALNDYDDAVDELDDIEEEEEDLENDFDDAENRYNQVKDDYEDAASAFTRISNEYQAQIAIVANLQTEADSLNSGDLGYDEAQQALADGSILLAQLQTVMNSAQAEYLSLKTDYDQRFAAYTAAQAEYEAAKAKRETQKSITDTLENTMEMTLSNYENAQNSYNYTVETQASAVAASESAVANAQLSAQSATQSPSTQVENFSEQLAKGVLTAPVSGTITTVNIEAGDIYAGSPIVTIDDCDTFIVTANIDEYDIADLDLGMKVQFKTDSTREELLDGEIIFISPTPNPTSLDVAYKVEIAIHSSTDRLRQGMNAKVSIITSETLQVLTVPYDAVQLDNAGQTVVYVADETDQSVQRAIPVTVGVEGDYYVEISGEGLDKGLKVILPVTETPNERSMMGPMGNGGNN